MQNWATACDGGPRLQPGFRECASGVIGIKKIKVGGAGQSKNQSGRGRVQAGRLPENQCGLVGFWKEIKVVRSGSLKIKVGGGSSERIKVSGSDREIIKVGGAAPENNQSGLIGLRK